jgi:hypothetical protein
MRCVHVAIVVDNITLHWNVCAITCLSNERWRESRFSNDSIQREKVQRHQIHEQTKAAIPLTSHVIAIESVRESMLIVLEDLNAIAISCILYPKRVFGGLNSDKQGDVRASTLRRRKRG